MSTPAQVKLLAAFPFLREAENTLREEIFGRGSLVQLSPGQFVAMEGTACSHLPLVLRGTVRVYKTGANGREVTLYRIERGESCILTTSCMLSGLEFPASAVAQTTVEAFAVPSPLVTDWLERFPSWRSWVFSIFPRRLASIITVVEDVAFGRVSSRLAELLTAAGTAAGTAIETTHEAIAADLGTSREVVSRILKGFERQGLLELGRGRIVLRDAGGLKRITTDP